MNKHFVSAFIGVFLMAVLFDFWMASIPGYTWFVDINWSLRPTLLSIQQFITWAIEAGIVLFVSYPRKPINNPLAAVIRMGLMLGLTCVMICHLNLALHLDSVPTVFLTESLLLFSLVNTLKYITLVAVVYMLTHRLILPNPAT